MTAMLTIALPACAEAAQPDAFFDWSYLATYSGAVAAVVFIVQFLKLPIDKLGHVPTRVLVYVVSLAGLLLAQLFTGNAFTPEVIALASGKGSALGTGGMITKLYAARRCAEAGCDTVIANGAHPENLYSILEGKACGTRFLAEKKGEEYDHT